ncbi:MAG: orotate phosphoribosyltransferase [Deltaproteobacteria bacterium]|nr:orotate phosphoribosyltransferase [Deltaproteobacteria bacterium]MBK7065727.1 orotate phosphoribosyltransferase [Deltaproteobacteria bacterium]
MESSRQRLLERLRTDAWRRGTFRLASGRDSDFFIDCKQVILTAEGHRLCGEVLCEVIRASGLGEEADAVAGVALGGCPLASAVSLTSALGGGRSWDALYVRKEPKDHGTAQRIEGRVSLAASLRVVLLEDVLTTGGSSRTAVEALRADGHTVLAVVALVDRREGGREALEAMGLRVIPVFSRADFLGE